MPSRRELSVTLALALAGCFSSDSSDFDPDSHVPDEWHDEPKRGVAESLERSVEMDPADLSGTLEDECDEAAGRNVSDVVRDRLDDPDNLVVFCCSDVEGHEKSVIVNRRMSVSRGGNLLSAPDFTFEALRDATPESATITASMYDDEHTCSAPVFVEDVLEREA